MTITIQELEDKIKHLKQELLESEILLRKLKLQDSSKLFTNDFTRDEIVRYSRQILTSPVNICGQTALKNSKVLIIGCGGLGCPASIYLASAGVGELTIVDYDEVELSNLHRQILHSESDIGIPKVESAFNTLTSINGNIKIIPIKEHINSKTVQDLVQNNKYDVVIDGTDNVATRYLLNDVCVLNGLPLVSGSALQFEGQLTVYNYKKGPCYRCMFPKPPPPETVTNCGDGGVIGPGTIGVLQALEAIKIIVGVEGVLSGRLLLFDGTTTTFRNVKLRERNKNCDICGDDPKIKELIDYEQFCGSNAHDKVININIMSDHEKVKPDALTSPSAGTIVIDVRPKSEYDMCKLPNTINMPYTDLIKGKCNDELKKLFLDNNNVYILCRRGNDSQRSIVYMKKQFGELPVNFFNVSGGLHGYSKHVNSDFPIY